MKKIAKTPYHSYKTGSLAKGCKQCVKGEKEVIFITGLCPRSCFYCPISKNKYQKDVQYANEQPITNKSQLIGEAELCSSKGAGFTGGDPLAKLDRTINYIKALKKHFGKSFHIHLYTSLNLITKQNLKMLFKAGLDEIRLHPDIDDPQIWPKIMLVHNLNWDIVIEIPAIPGKIRQTKQLIDYFSPYINYLNINELEISDTNANSLLENGFVTKNSHSYAVKNSHQTALKILTYAQTRGINTHYCTTTLKDRVQLKNRIKKRAKKIKLHFDIITQEGTLLRGAIYHQDLIPGFDYLNKIRKNKNTIIPKLRKLQKMLSKKTVLDQNRPRLLISPKEALEIVLPKEFSSAVIEEYPTYDAMIVELNFIKP